MPTPTKYTYSISTDFPSGLASDRLDRDTRANTSISIALDRIDTSGDVCDVWFRDVLSGPEETVLDGLVAAHSGEHLPSEPILDASGHMVSKLYPDTSVGLPSIMVLDIPDAAIVRLKSYQVIVPALTTLIKDIFIGDDFIGAQGKCYLSGGEYRVRATNGHGAAAGSALHLAIVDRDNVTGYFPYFGLTRTKLAGLTDIVGTITAGEAVTGGTSGTNAEVLSVGVDSCDVTYHDGPFTDGESLTFSGGATATLGDWDEGDVIEIVRNVKDEWIEDYDHRDYSPGGSREIPAGMYLRIIAYNAHATDDLRVKVSFTFGAL